MTVQESASVDIVQARQSFYQFLLQALDKPNEKQHVWLKSETFRDSLLLLCEEFELPYPEGELFPEHYADYESRYLACFEVGFPEPPVVLLASHYHRHEPAPRIIHEHQLFYGRFGVKLAVDNPEPADHLSNELSFLLWLDDLISRYEMEAESIIRARHDFLERHLARWTGEAVRNAEEKHLPPIYCALFGLLALAIQQDLAITKESVN